MTTVNVNVTDTAGQPWANGTISAQLQTAFGAHLNVPPVTSVLDSSGNATITLAANLAITPPGSGWYITACPQATSPCYARAYTIAGSTQDLNIRPPAIKINLQSTRAVVLPIHATAYSSSEISGAEIGSIYYDLTTQELMVLETLPNGWVAVSGGGDFATIPFVENLVANPTEIDSVSGIPIIGLPLIVYSGNSHNQQGSQSLLLTPQGGPGSLIGPFRVSVYLVVTTPSLTDTLQVIISYTDDSGANSIASPAAPVTTPAHAKISDTILVQTISGDVQLDVVSHDGTAHYQLYINSEFIF